MYHHLPKQTRGYEEISITWHVSCRHPLCRAPAGKRPVAFALHAMALEQRKNHDGQPRAPRRTEGRDRADAAEDEDGARRFCGTGNARSRRRGRLRPAPRRGDRGALRL